MTSVVLSALFAGVIASLITVGIERLGGRRGGVLGTLPSTIVPAAAGLFVTSPDHESFTVALATTPAGMLVNVLFLLAFREISSRLSSSLGAAARLLLTLALSLALWGGAALAVTVVVRAALARAIPPLAIAGPATLLILLFGIAATRSSTSAPPARRRVGPLVVALRGVMAALAVGAAVALARSGAPVVAGLAAVFPAIFITTMVTLTLAQGFDVPRAAAGPMMLGSTSVAAYAILATLTLPRLGLVVGSALAWVIAAVGVTLPLVRLVARATTNRDDDAPRP